jgi:chromosome segregation ATPase
MWRLRRKTERGWNDGFHINTKAEAEGLCELLSKLERERDEALSDLEFRRDLFKLQEQQLNDVRAERDRLAEERDELAERITNEICRVSSVCRELKEELAVERALADRLVKVVEYSAKIIGPPDGDHDSRRLTDDELDDLWDRTQSALAAWKGGPL